MPGWLIAALTAYAVLLVAWWAETRATTIIVELKAIRANLKAIRANLVNPGADSTDGEGDNGESSERGSELPGRSANR